jgi:hypothetical protein
MTYLKQVEFVCIKVAETLHEHAEKNQLTNVSDLEGEIYTNLAEMLGIGYTNIESDSVILTVLSEIPLLVCLLENERLHNPNLTQFELCCDLLTAISRIHNQNSKTDNHTS